MTITNKQHTHLLDHGYVVIPRFVPPADLKVAQRALQQYFPSPALLTAKPHHYKHITESPDFQQIEFPYTEHALNQMAVHPKLIALAEKLLATREVMLSRSSLWAKYAGLGEFEQEMHVDYEGNTLVAPRDDGDYRQINLILYYSDVDETLGPTNVLSQQFTRDDPLWPPFRPREKWPQFYENSTNILAKAGDLLVFSMRTFHRATSLTAGFGARFTQHLIYRGKRHLFQGYQHWPSFGEQAELQSFLERASVRQREALGFPSPGDPYWNEHTLAAVATRYPGMDMAPYRRGTRRGKPVR